MKKNTYNRESDNFFKAPKENGAGGISYRSEKVESNDGESIVRVYGNVPLHQNFIDGLDVKIDRMSMISDVEEVSENANGFFNKIKLLFLNNEKNEEIQKNNMAEIISLHDKINGRALLQEILHDRRMNKYVSSMIPADTYNEIKGKLSNNKDDMIVTKPVSINFNDIGNSLSYKTSYENVESIAVLNNIRNKIEERILQFKKSLS